jgi:hypothetical protein
VRQLLSHVQRVLAVLFGGASCFVKQIEDRLSCFVELITAWRKWDYFLCGSCSHPQSSESGGDLTDKTTEKQSDHVYRYSLTTVANRCALSAQFAAFT